MRITRRPLVLAIALIVASPFALVAQGASKGSPAPKNPPTAQPATKSTATQAPAAQTPAPAAAQTAATAPERAKCKDGSMYSGASRKGACSSHGGVAEWLTMKGATARCNDGTFYAKAERQGACSGHKGVAEWLKKS